MRLMLTAAATVSRKRREQPDQIRDLKAYLWTTFKHFISDEVEKESRYQPLELEGQSENGAIGPTESPYDQILIEEVMAQMDSWTRKVFELRVLGYQFDDIAQMFKMRPDLLRSKFHNEIKKPSHRLRGCRSSADRRISAVSGSDSGAYLHSSKKFFSRRRLLPFHSLYEL